jgi:sugar phosphate isomerase/epimerase
MEITRRRLLQSAAIAPLAGALAQTKKVPIGLELFSVRKALAEDLMGTVRKVASIGYEDVEFYAPYYGWTLEQAKDVRKLMDDVGIKCLSTHNSISNYRPENVQKTIEYNKILGSGTVVIASAGQAKSLDDWKKIADTLAEGHERLRAAGLRGGYHNHQTEFTPLEGKRPIEVIAAGTPKEFVMQLDVGTCVEMGSDPVAWINANPGRIRCMHLKDWNREKGYRVLYGEGSVPWKQLLQAGMKTGGVEFLLIEQEGSEFSEFETAEKCLAAYRKGA